jgi:putative transposase
MEVGRASSAVYEIAYHIVWCPKYRRKIPDAVQASLRTSIMSICEARGWTVKELVINVDHIHLFIGAPPVDSPLGIVKTLKGITARLMFEQHPVLRAMFTHGHLWSPSYYVGTVGHVSEETVARYIQDQKERTVGRPKKPASSPQ